jgi:hypothetical protein
MRIERANDSFALQWPIGLCLRHRLKSTDVLLPIGNAGMTIDALPLLLGFFSFQDLNTVILSGTMAGMPLVGSQNTSGNPRTRGVS